MRYNVANVLKSFTIPVRSRATKCNMFLHFYDYDKNSNNKYICIHIFNHSRATTAYELLNYKYSIQDSNSSISKLVTKNKK